MLSVHGRKTVAPVVEPIARALNSAGVTPNQMTVVGMVVAVALSVTLIPSGHLTAAAISMGLFAAFDLLDGTMARLRGGGTKFGAVLDASCDRITDGALFGSIAWWVWFSYGAPKPLLAAILVAMVAAQVTSYVKARAEASGLKVTGGLVERAERLIIALVGVGLHGLGVPYAVDVAMVLLAVGGVATVVQRLAMVRRQPAGAERIAAPSGCAEPDSGRP